MKRKDLSSSLPNLTRAGTLSSVRNKHKRRELRIGSNFSGEEEFHLSHTPLRATRSAGSHKHYCVNVNVPLTCLDKNVLKHIKESPFSPTSHRSTSTSYQHHNTSRPHPHIQHPLVTNISKRDSMSTSGGGSTIGNSSVKRLINVVRSTQPNIGPVYSSRKLCKNFAALCLGHAMITAVLIPLYTLQGSLSIWGGSYYSVFNKKDLMYDDLNKDGVDYVPLVNNDSIWRNENMQNILSQINATHRSTKRKRRNLDNVPLQKDKTLRNHRNKRYFNDLNQNKGDYNETHDTISQLDKRLLKTPRLEFSKQTETLKKDFKSTRKKIRKTTDIDHDNIELRLNENYHEVDDSPSGLSRVSKTNALEINVENITLGSKTKAEFRESFEKQDSNQLPESNSKTEINKPSTEENEKIGLVRTNPCSSETEINENFSSTKDWKLNENRKIKSDKTIKDYDNLNSNSCEKELGKSERKNKGQEDQKAQKKGKRGVIDNKQEEDIGRIKYAKGVIDHHKNEIIAHKTLMKRNEKFKLNAKGITKMKMLNGKIMHNENKKKRSEQSSKATDKVSTLNNTKDDNGNDELVYKTVHNIDHGSLLLALLFFVGSISSIYSPFYVNKFGIKLCFIKCYIVVSIFIGSHFYPNIYLLIFVYVLFGIFIGTLAQTRIQFLMLLSNKFAMTLCNSQDDFIQTQNTLLQQLSRIFILAQDIGIMFGGIITYILVYNIDYKYFDYLFQFKDDGGKVCGSSYCPFLYTFINDFNIESNSDHIEEMPIKKLMVSNVSTDLNLITDLSPHNMYSYTILPCKVNSILLSVYLGFTIISVILSFIFIDKIKSSFHFKSKLNGNPFSICNIYNSYFRYVEMTVKHSKLQLTAPLSLFIGLEQGFMYSDFMKSYVSCVIGTVNVPLVLISSSLLQSVAAFTLSLLLPHVTRYYVLLVGLVFHSCLLLVLIVWLPAEDDAALLYVISSAWGVCNTIWDTLVFNAIIEIYPEYWQGPIAHSYFFKYIGLALSFGIHEFVCNYIKFYILSFTLILAVVSFAYLQYKINNKNVNINTNYQNNVVVNRRQPSSHSIPTIHQLS